jgi:hypothetical protein
MHLLGVVWLRWEEGVVVDSSLSIRPGSLGLASPRSFVLLLVGVLHAMWPAN